MGNLGGGYTFANIDDELYLTVMYLHLCMKASRQRQELDKDSSDGAKTFYSPQGLGSGD